MTQALGVAWTVETLQSAERRHYRPMAFVARFGSLWGMVRVWRSTLLCDCWVQDDAAPKLFVEQAQAESIWPAMTWCSEMMLERAESRSPGRLSFDRSPTPKPKKRARPRYKDQRERRAVFDAIHEGQTHSALARALCVSVTTVSRINSGHSPITDAMWERIRKMQEG